MYIYIYIILIQIACMCVVCAVIVRLVVLHPRGLRGTVYGQFSTFHVCFCGLDPGNLKFESTDK